MDLDIRTIVGSESQRAVKHELHVTGAGSLSTCQGDLLGDLSRRHEYLGQGNAVILQEYDGELLTDLRVVLDLLADAPDHLDDLLCDVVSGSGLGSEDVCLWNKVSVRILEQVVIVSDDVHRVQLLALIFVQALYLNIKDGIQVQLCAGGLFNILSERLLVLLLDLAELLKYVLVVSEHLELDKLCGIFLEAVADAL